QGIACDRAVLRRRSHHEQWRQDDFNQDQIGAAMYLPAPTESNFTPVPAGTHLGICYRVIDLGTQSTNFNGETKLAHKVLVSWEIPDEKMDDGRPFTISQSYTWSMHEK